MKALPWILVVFLAIACVALCFRPVEPEPPEIRVETNTKTIVKVDTLLISSPLPPAFFFETKDTIRLGDIVVNRQQAVYVDSLYRAWVSGYRPRLDSIEVYPRTVTNTITNDIYHTVKVRDSKRWGIGVQVGYGMTGNMVSPYVGVGISYNLFNW